MKLHRITITNFRSFKGEQTFRFPDQPGLYFMQGVNEAEPRLEANGAGKTTIWEALTWVLFGKTSRGLKAGDVCNWDAGKGTKVELAFDEGDNLSLQVMTRTWSPNSWTLQDLFGNTTDLTRDQSNPVLARLKLDFSPFLNSILTAQGQPMFLDQKHDVKAALFSDVMGLDRWLDYSTKASKKASAQDAVSRGYERDLSRTKGQLESLQGQDHVVSLEQWEALQKKALDAVARDYERELQKSADLKKQMPALQKDVDEDHAAVREARDFVEGAKLDLRDMKEHARKAGLDEMEARTNYQHAKGHNDALDGGSCPTCGQSIAKVSKAVFADQATMKKVWEKAKTRSDDAEENVRRAEKDLDKDEDELETETARLLVSTNKLKDAQRNLQFCERNLDTLEEKAEELQREVNPFAELETKARREIERLSDEMSALQRCLDDSNGRYSLFSFWVRGFKELRLQLIAEALTELELEVNSCVTALGLVDWELLFEVDRMTKGGSVQRGFNVFVGSPHNSAPVPWEAWSGGEAQRLRLAATMGLANLIRSRSGTQINLEVWDEPSNGLSAQGIKDLLESLANRARRESRQIWVVDHMAHSFGDFAGGATITKTASGSKLKQY